MTEVDKRYVKASNSASFCRIQNTKKLTWFLEAGESREGKKTKCSVCVKIRKGKRIEFYHESVKKTTSLPTRALFFSSARTDQGMSSSCTCITTGPGASGGGRGGGAEETSGKARTTALTTGEKIE